MTANTLPKTQDLSPAARTALTNVGTSRQGATIPTTTSAGTFQELLELGLIGAGRGLTMRGSIIRDRIQDEDLDLYF